MRLLLAALAGASSSVPSRIFCISELEGSNRTQSDRSAPPRQTIRFVVEEFIQN